jgi:PHD/YefM family antitoxin component YafN of YafNO toxin-antitoxin module
MNGENINIINVKEPSVLITKKEFDEIKETLDILSDNELVKEIAEALSENNEDRINHEDLFGK